MAKIGSALALLLILAALAAAPARAANVAVSGTVTGGAALAVASNGTPSFSLTLNGADQTATYTLPVAGDRPARLAAPAGTSPSPRPSSKTRRHTRFRRPPRRSPPRRTSCSAGSTCTAATNAVTLRAPALPSAPVAPAAVKFFNAAANSGMGKMDVNATVSVAVPANIFAGTYSSTVTVSIVSGP